MNLFKSSSSSLMANSQYWTIMAMRGMLEKVSYHAPQLL